MADLWEDYAAGRTREEELDEVRPMVTPQEAEQIGNIRHAEHTSLRDIGSAIASSSAARPIMDYVIRPIGTAIDAYEKLAGHFRGTLIGEPSKEAKGSDLTGIQSEPFTKQMENDLFDGPWYKAPLAAASIVANRPKAALNFAAEMATDPLNLALGAGMAVRAAKGGMSAAKEATARTVAVDQSVAADQAATKATLQDAQKVVPQAQPGIGGASPEPVLPKPGEQNTLESVKRDRHFDLAQADPTLEYVGAKTIPTKSIITDQPQVVSMQAAKDLTKSLLISQFSDKATQFAFRGTSLEELKSIVKEGRLSIGADAEGVPGISAALIDKEGFPVYGDGVGYVVKRGEFADSGRSGEVLVNDTLDPKQLQYVVNGKIVDFDGLKSELSSSGRRPLTADEDSVADVFANKFKKGEPVDRVVLEQSGSGYNVISGKKRTVGAERAGVTGIHADVFKPKVGSTALPKVEPPVVTLTNSTDVKQTILPGFGRSLRQKEGLPELEGPEAHKIPDPAQQTLIFSKVMDVEEWHGRALRALDLASHGDKDMTARARVLLDKHMVTPWSIKAHARVEPPKSSKFNPSDFKEQDYIAASAAVEASFAEDFAKFAKAYEANPSSALLEKLMVKLTGAKEVTSALMADAAKHGAALRAEKTRQRPVVRAMEAMIRDLPPGTTPERMVEAFNSLSKPAQKSEFLRGLMGHAKGIKSNFLGVYLNSLLSTSMGLSVFAGNFTAGTALFATRLAEKRMASLFSHEVLPNEAGVQAYAFVKSYMDLAAASYKNRKGLPLTESEAQVSKEFSTRREKAVARWRGEDPIRNISGPKLKATDSIYEWGLDAMTRILNIPSFVIGHGDAVLGFAVKQSAMESAAYREAMLQAQAAVRSGKELSPAEFSKLVSDRRQELMRNPDSKVLVGGKMTPLSQLGESEADLINMMSDVKGKVGGAIQSATEDSLGFRALVPFFRVMYNSSAEAIYRTPVLSLVSPKNVADFSAGGERRAMAMARVGMGGMLAASAVGLTSAGVFVSDGPADPAMRRVYRMDQANKPGIHIGETYVPYEKLGSIGQLLRTVANMSYMLPRIDNEEAAQQWSIAMMGTLASAITDVRVAKDLHDLAGAASMRDAKGFEKYLEELPARMVPYSSFLRQVVQQTEGHIVASEGVLGNIMAMVPGHSKQVYYNEVGEISEVPNWRSWNGLKKDFGWSPLPTTDPMKKTVYANLEKDQVHITGPARTQSPHVQLPVDAYMELRRLYGNESFGGKTLFEALSELQANKAYQAGTNGPNGSKQDLISSVTSAYKSAAWSKLLSQKENGQLKWKDLVDEVERAERFKAGRP